MNESRPQLVYEDGIRNPDRFTALLITELSQDHPFAEACFTNAVELGLIQQTIHIDTNTSESSISKSEITIGIAPLEAEVKALYFFEPDNITYGEEVVYRIIHEVSHEIITYMHDHDASTRELEFAFYQMRKSNPLIGVSRIGGTDEYVSQGSIVQADEDIVELLTMFLWNPNYFNQYIEFLRNTPEDKLIELGLTKISATVAENLVTKISGIAKRFSEIEN